MSSIVQSTLPKPNKSSPSGLHRVIVFNLALAFVLAACSFSLAEDVTPPPGYQPPPPRPEEPAQVFAPSAPVQAPDPAQGAAIYVESCAPVMAPQGWGTGPRRTSCRIQSRRLEIRNWLELPSLSIGSRWSARATSRILCRPLQACQKLSVGMCWLLCSL